MKELENNTNIKLDVGANCETFSFLKSATDFFTKKCDVMTGMHDTISDFHLFLH